MNYEALQAQNAEYKALIQQQNKVMKLYEEKLQNAMDQIAQLQRIIYGAKSERFVPVDNQLNLFSDLLNDKKEDELQTQQIKAHQRELKKSKHKGRQLLSQCGHLEVEEQMLDIDHSEESKKIGEVITEKLAYKPGKLYRIRYKRPKYKDPKTQEIKIAELPEVPIDKCEADVSLLAHISVSKFVDHLPEYRQQQMFKREGVVIPPATMNNWTHRIAQLIQPVCHHIKQQILNTGYIQIDESTIKVMSGKKNRTHLGYMWVLNSPEQDMVYFEYDTGRSKAAGEKMIPGYEGEIQSDGYEVYESLNKSNDSQHFLACMAHARRYFDKALANDRDRSEYVLKKIQQLYQIESRCREDSSTAEQRKQIRQEMAKPILKELKTYLDEQALTATPASAFGKALGYTIKRWKKLIRYLDNGRLEIDNNLIENAIRPLALGRKNYLFAGNHDAAANIANFYTIFGTCKKLGVNPYKYMVWCLQRINGTNIQQIHSISPVNYKKILKKKGV